MQTQASAGLKIDRNRQQLRSDKNNKGMLILGFRRQMLEGGIS